MELWHWIGFGALVVVLLAMDMLLFHRRDHAPSLWESAGWSAFWIALGLAFNGLIWWLEGPVPGMQFLTGYLVEKALSMDNIFVFAVIFRYFHVPLMYQYRVLFWGILGAIFMRLGFILAGAALIRRFDWVLPIFGVLLVYTAYKLLRHGGAEVHPDQNVVLRLARRFLRVSRGDHHQHGHHFFVHEGGRLCLTPMFLVLLVIESTDVVFAVDSVPAIFGITQDAFIIFTSNIFAILGLRALYFLLAGVIEIFRYLHYGLSGVLGFIGLKMIAEWWFPGAHVPIWVSLLVIGVLLGVSIGASLVAGRRERLGSGERGGESGEG